MTGPMKLVCHVGTRDAMRRKQRAPSQTKGGLRADPIDLKEQRRGVGGMTLRQRMGQPGYRSNAGSSWAVAIQLMRSATWMCIVGGSAPGSSRVADCTSMRPGKTASFV